MSKTFTQFMRAVDAILMDAIGLSSDDLRDRCWRDSFDDGSTPREAIEDLCGDPSDIDAFMQAELWG